MSKKFKKTILVVLSSLLLIAGAVYLAGYFLFGYFINFIFKTPDSGLQALPCAPASQVELGYPFTGGETAEFTTTGGKLYVYARYFAHGMLLPAKGLSSIDVGNVNAYPTWDKQRNIVTNVIKTTYVPEKKYGEINLPAGRYWLWSGAGDIVIYNCDPNGVSDPKPVGQTME